MSISKHVDEIKKIGLTKIPNLIPHKKCEYLKNVSLSIIDKLKNRKTIFHRIIK